MAVRTALSASSGCTKSAGGGWWPTRWSAANHFDDDAAALVERFAQSGFLRVERVEPPAGRLDVGLDLAHARRGIDQLLVERAAILADRLDLAPELGLFSAETRSSARTASSS